MNAKARWAAAGIRPADSALVVGDSVHEVVSGDSSTTETSTVEFRRRWPVLVLVVAVVVAAGLSTITADLTDDGTALGAGQRFEESVPEQQDLSTSVEIVGAPQIGFFYGIGHRGRLVQVDLTSGSVRRSSETFGDALALEATASGVLVVGSLTRIVDDDLETVTSLDGRYLASRPGEIWTLRGSDKVVQRYNEVGGLDLVIPAGVLGNVGDRDAAREAIPIAGALPKRLSPAQPRRSSWWVNTDAESPSISTDSAGPVLGVDGSALAIRCAGNPPQCQWVLYRFGTEIDLLRSRDDVWSATTSPSGKYALTDGPGGTNLVDMRRLWDESSVPMQSGDAWARGADLIMRVSDTMVTVVDLAGEVVASVTLPADVARRNRAPQWTPSMLVIHDG